MTPQEAIVKTRALGQPVPTLAQVKAFLRADGFRVIGAENGLEYWGRTSNDFIIVLPEAAGHDWVTLYDVAKRKIALNCCYKSPDMADELMTIVAQIEVAP